MPIGQFEQLVGEIRRGSLTGWIANRVTAWAAVAAIDIEYDEPKSAPYSAMRRRDWHGAANADDKESLVEALEIARGLGAEPLARRVAKRLRELGFRVPRDRGRRRLPARLD